MNPSGYCDLLNTNVLSSDVFIITGTLNVPNLDANSAVVIDASNNLSDVLLNNGELVIGVTSGPPVAGSITGTTNQITVSNGPGSISLSTPQDIAVTSSPTFNDLTITNNIAGPNNSRSADDIVSNPTGATIGNIAEFSSDTVIQDSGIQTTYIVTNTGSVVPGNIAEFSSDNVIQDSGINVSSLSGGPFLSLAGGVMTGDINMNSNDILNSGLITPAITSTHDLGTSSARFKNIYLSGSVAGPTNTRLVDNIVSNTTTTTSNNLCSFTDSSGKLIKDSSIQASNVVSKSGGTVTSGHLAAFSGTSGRLITSSGIASTDLVSNSGSSTNNNIASFNGTSGKIIQDGNILTSNIVSNTGGTVTDGQLAVFSGTTGRLITSSGTSLSSYLPLAGGTMSGTINMSSNDITSIKNITMSGSSLTGTNAIISIDDTYSDGNYITFGSGGGRNIGVFNLGPFFFSYNANYNTTSNVFTYQSNGAATFMQLNSSNGHLQYAAAGLAGNNVTVVDSLKWSNNGNIAIGWAPGSYGSGEGVIFITNRTVPPGSNPSGGGILYCEAGALKYRGSSGTVTTIAAA
jgi:hypothetical protein